MRRKLTTTHIFETGGSFESLLVNWVPHVDVIEQDKHFVIYAELPGVAVGDIAVELQSNVLILEGLKRDLQLSQGYQCYYCVERAHGRFRREIQLPNLVDIRHGEAILDNGILRITLTRIEDRRGQSYRIPVQKSDSSRKL
ncbi:MAG TPA: Hsp20/alpha crystallin family protein [Acidobacteriota bacterium]|nr:Hsp20/alpha crystallin family protein [Acidobacteriota bacterium]